ncbi:hypothetical protein [Burkholderia ubonensis]|uniref:hypothetical protein n=2 Tax=Burkholderia cepacia complex TaxID=87882 RepID=UPI0011605641|nr:hypothetical protein [Burkholderia ubonensis]
MKQIETNALSTNMNFDIDAKEFAYDAGASRGTAVIENRFTTTSPSVAKISESWFSESCLVQGTAPQSRPRTVSVSVTSSTATVTLAVKPSVIASEERQQRLNESIRLGFLPPSRNTAA